MWAIEVPFLERRYSIVLAPFVARLLSSLNCLCNFVGNRLFMEEADDFYTVYSVLTIL